MIAEILKLKEIFREVGKEIGKGHSEVVYRNAIMQELQINGISFTHEETLPLTYKGRFVGIERLDICLEATFLPVIIELKAVPEDLKLKNIWQLSSYMKTKQYPYGLLVNFNQTFGKPIQMKVLYEDKLFDPVTNSFLPFDSPNYI